MLLLLLSLLLLLLVSLLPLLLLELLPLLLLLLLLLLLPLLPPDFASPHPTSPYFVSPHPDPFLFPLLVQEPVWKYSKLDGLVSMCHFCGVGADAPFPGRRLSPLGQISRCGHAAGWKAGRHSAHLSLRTKQAVSSMADAMRAHTSGASLLLAHGRPPPSPPRAFLPIDYNSALPQPATAQYNMGCAEPARPSG